MGCLAKYRHVISSVPVIAFTTVIERYVNTTHMRYVSPYSYTLSI